VKGLYEQMKPVLDKSEQPIFIYLDDNHKVCNSKFATMLGYKSPEDLASNGGFLDVFLAEKSQETLSTAYWNAMNKMIASTIQLTLTKKSGVTIETTMILVPIFFQGHLFSIHFVTMISS
jgi:hypothetical protein